MNGLRSNHLPGNTEADNFCTDNASGSTSQAANLLEALEVGARVLLLDEDTCATNLLIRDARMQALVEKSGEPITPFLDRVPQLNQRGISTILVLGGCGDYFDVADTVIRMDAFEPRDVTAEAQSIARRHPTGRTTELETDWPLAGRPRIPLAASLDPSQGHREIRITARALRAVQFGREEIDVSLVAQLVDEGQLRAVGHALELVRRQWTAQPDQDFKTGLDQLMARLAQEGLDILDDRARGDYVEFRIFELAAALNRLRSLKVRNR